MSMHAYGVRPIDVGSQDDVAMLELTLSEARATEPLMEELRSTLKRHPGESEVHLNLITPHSVRVFELREQVRISADLFGELKGMLGPRCLLPVEEALV